MVGVDGDEENIGGIGELGLSLIGMTRDEVSPSGIGPASLHLHSSPVSLLIWPSASTLPSIGFICSLIRSSSSSNLSARDVNDFNLSSFISKNSENASNGQVDR